MTEQQSGVSRRRLLGAAAGGVALSLLPPSLHKAMAQPMRPGGLAGVEHVIVLMQENRSFDHYYGRLRGVRGYADRNPLTLPTGESVFRQPKPGGGEVLPFSLREGAQREGRAGSDIQYLGDLNHSFDGTTKAWGKGWNNDWIAAKTAATMTYYERQDIPLQYELADAFTLCDAYHCSVFGSTNPNRNYLWTGTTGNEPGTQKRAVDNAAYGYDHKGYDWTTYPERLQQAGVSWQIYQEWDNFTDNAVEYFVPFKKVGAKILKAVGGGYRTTEEFYDALGSKTPLEQQQLLAKFRSGVSSLDKDERALFEKAMYRSEPGTLVSRLQADIKARTLPKVSWLVPSGVDSEHPGSSTPVGSANLIYRVLDAIASDPETWSKTVLFINFDENDGFFDHVPPPVQPRPASGNDTDWWDGRPIGLGPRVPMTVVSPWTVGGHVNSEVFDHTSVLRFLEKWTGVAEPNISQWRRTVCGDLTSVFDFQKPGTTPKPQQPGPVPAPIKRWHPTPPATQTQPGQEPGRRPARALPYRITTRSRLDGDGHLRIRLDNAGTQSAHFAIYPYAGEFAEPKHLDVRGDHPEFIKITGSSYRLAVQGPNRFWHELAGSVSGAAAHLEVAVRSLPLRSGLIVALINGDQKPVTVRVRALGFGSQSDTVTLQPWQEKVLQWPTDEGWYDVEVTCDQDPSFRRRITGRVENGKPGQTA
ncbi:phospholipase C, phosphocholine-specific [Pseudonocardiaceae bacterium YIM PH 21723]|nr:phospholipase C, phosphocholine-specific [Pseudonocardiaceae bacterium YIM PH 21723]